jgi:ABC-type polysaccharide/polyol phosphate export permease
LESLAERGEITRRPAQTTRVQEVVEQAGLADMRPVPYTSRSLSKGMESLPQDAAYLNPMRYFLIIVRSVFLQQATTGLLVSEYWPMAVIALVALTAAGLTFRLRMY